MAIAPHSEHGDRKRHADLDREAADAWRTQ